MTARMSIFESGVRGLSTGSGGEWRWGTAFVILSMTPVTFPLSEGTQMSIHVELPAQEVAALRQITNADNVGEAVAKAAREFLRMSRLRELKAASGKVDFALDWQALEAIELTECDLPK
jgi:hypothetical protein